MDFGDSVDISALLWLLSLESKLWTSTGKEVHRKNERFIQIRTEPKLKSRGFVPPDCCHYALQSLQILKIKLALGERAMRTSLFLPEKFKGE